MAQCPQPGDIRAYVFIRLRASEVLSLDREDLHLEGMWARVTGKGGKERIVPFGEKAKEALEAYLALAGKIDKFNANKALFINFRGDRLTYRGLLRIMKKHQIKAHLFKNLALHGSGIRSPRICWTMEPTSGAIQELLGHSKLSTTQRYTHISMDKLMEIYDKSHPRR